eukprot:TRINITY_DN33520_c0_g1_i1.p1 TRINITY_DN33520_c0_g1~~TRINITY_DN33520_c0_g1_i1.p1  ORF type:complete len:403 (+),score=59.65 TRINITY_DN33520_c0_g1_i1:66-1274(+)
MMASWRVLLVGVVTGRVLALDNGLGRTPQMGYNSWYDVECSSWDERMMQRTADAMVSKGLVELGYRYFNLDDCWAKGRNEDGSLYADKRMFPSGTLKELADYVHSKGMLFGTYTDRGSATCAGRPGAQGHEDIDAATYAAWGVDYLKEDSCNAADNAETAFSQYGKMRDSLNATGRAIFFSICGWHAWYAPEGSKLGNSWRIGPDDTNWAGILTNIDIMAGLSHFAGPGGWNDPCLLLSRTWDSKSRVTELQTRAQFSMWAILAAPLLISGNILNMSAATLETYSNREVIGVNQDSLGKQGVRIMGGALKSGSSNVWARPLQDGSHALLFINTAPGSANVTCDPTCFAALDLHAEDTLSVRDLWAKNNLPDVSGATMSVQLEGNGGHTMVIVKRRGKVALHI